MLRVMAFFLSAALAACAGTVPADHWTQQAFQWTDRVKQADGWGDPDTWRGFHKSEGW